jgi:hypothetical protein
MEIHTRYIALQKPETKNIQLSELRGSCCTCEVGSNIFEICCSIPFLLDSIYRETENAKDVVMFNRGIICQHHAVGGSRRFHGQGAEAVARNSTTAAERSTCQQKNPILPGNMGMGQATYDITI